MPSQTKPHKPYRPTHCVFADCPNEPADQSLLCAEHLEQDERFQRLFWGEMQHRIDERRGK